MRSLRIRWGKETGVAAMVGAVVGELLAGEVGVAERLEVDRETAQKTLWSGKKPSH